jgi:pimeloyl-ACP methyl ester carboxylesterase
MVADQELVDRLRPADLLIGEIRDAVGALDLYRIPRAGHWSAYENAPEVNRLMLEFFSS